MKRLLIVAIVLLPIAAALALSGQDPSFDPRSGSYGFSSDEFPGEGSYLGVDTRDITPDRITSLKLKDESGVEVTMVDQDAPAGKAGIKEHDVILTINGSKVESVEQLRRMIREIPAGRVAKIGISRNGQPVNFEVQLAERGKFMASHNMPRIYKFKVPPIPPIPPMPEFEVPTSVVVVRSSMRSGLSVENLTPQLGEFFGAKEGHGVLIRTVERGSQADKAGFRAGDVIVRVDKDPVHDTSDFSHAMQSHRGGGQVSVGILRDKKEQNLNLTIPERRQSGDLLDEESLQFPDIDINAEVGFDELRDAMPEIAIAVNRARREVEKVTRDLCNEQRHQHQQMRRQQREMQKQQQDMQKENKDLQKQMQDESLQWQQEWKKGQHELQRELLQLQHGFSEI
ncbi:MAG TPA: PDZ domain-containing protein [Terriglobales bacterium]|jgi:membrane-associated protease RseP (regulator of RpoE activity)